MLRILHFSDIHLPPGPTTFDWSDFAHHRRIVGYLNYLLRRKWEFGDALSTLAHLEEWGRKLGIEHALFTGDLSQIGAPGEILAGKAALDAFRAWPAGLTLIPGNHDRYIPERPGDSTSFDAVFREWYRSDFVAPLPGDRFAHPATPPSEASAALPCPTDNSWPRVTLLPENVALITLNTVIPHRWFWNAYGEIEAAQIEALQTLISLPELANRFLVIACHHAPFRPDGRRDDHFHGLHGIDALLETLAPRASCSMLVHGHIHRRLHLRSAETRNIPIFGAGSATYAGREAFWIYEFDNGHGRAHPGAWKDGTPVLESPAIALF